ncbi:MAG: flagellar biosynthesis repressor FlbT [Hyphomicrobiaceae bacterium]
MSKILKLRLKSGERIFVNGAVMQVDRRVAISFLNDVSFLLESYVIQPEEVTTPIRQLYFVLQSMLINPDTREEQLKLLQYYIGSFARRPEYAGVMDEIQRAADLATREQFFESLKLLRSIFHVDDPMPPAIQPAGSDSKQDDSMGLMICK